MLPKKNRLTKKKDFDLVFNKGKSVKNGFLIARVLENNLPDSRFGFVVSKKVSNKATVRNKVKRRLRGAVEDLIPKILKPKDFIFIALPLAVKQEFSKLQEAVINIFNKLP